MSRNSMRSMSFDTMLESVREYPDVLGVVGRRTAIDHIRGPGRALWEEFMALRKKYPFLQFAIVPYAENAQETLAYGCEVIEQFPKCNTHGVGYGKKRSICSSEWLREERRKFPKLLVRYYSGREVPRGLRCEIIDLFPVAPTHQLSAHMGVLFGYEQDGNWNFSRESHWRERIASGDTALPPMTLGLDVQTHGIRILPTPGQDFPKPGIYADATGGATWHKLWLRMGATKRGEYMNFGLPFEGEDRQYMRPVIIKTT